jgi:uncharacterized protein (DUF2249 family)
MSSKQPILASERVSDILNRYPTLVDTLIDASPAFRNLRNPIMRRVQSRLVTVSQAAGIAGLSPAELTRTLNVAAGLTAPSETDITEPGQPTSAEPLLDDVDVSIPPIAAEIDVRTIMARGEEPFKAIMSVASSVPAGAAFRLIASFEPLPLYDVLAKQGFTHRSHEIGDGAWEVLFTRAADIRHRSPKSARKAGSEDDWPTEITTEVTIDVSELVPPEPMIKILEALEQLEPGGRLLVHHVRRPIHLYDRLDEMGYRHQTRDLAPGNVEVMIEKPVGAS